jgi:hypothetical protein
MLTSHGVGKMTVRSRMEVLALDDHVLAPIPEIAYSLCRFDMLSTDHASTTSSSQYQSLLGTQHFRLLFLSAGF